MYNYQEQKKNLFTEEAQEEFLKVRDHVFFLLNTSGSFMMNKAWTHISGNTWIMSAYVDRMVELGEIKEIQYRCMGQDRVFIRAEQ
jgi:hypothetical protein